MGGQVVEMRGVEVTLPGPVVEVPARELQQALWLGLREQAERLEARAKRDDEQAHRLAMEGPSGSDMGGVVYDRAQGQTEAWRCVLDHVQRRAERHHKLASALRTLRRQMEDS